VSSYWKETKDTSTPGYLTLERSGKILCKDYSHKHVKDVSPIGIMDGLILSGPNKDKVEHHYLMRYKAFHAPVALPTLVQFPNVDAYAARVLTDAFAKANNAQMDGLVTIAEFHKSFRSIVSALGHVVRLLQKGVNAKRLLASGTISVARAANIWLEVRYGLRPIYYDIRNAIEALADLGTAKRTRFTSTLEWEESESLLGATTPLGYFGSFKYDTYENAMLIAKAGCIAEHRIDSETISDVFGLHAHDLPAMAWELIPFSFIVDWFFNVGKVIASLTPQADCTIVASWTTIEKQWTRGNTMIPCTGLNYARFSRNWQPSGVTDLHREYEKTRYADDEPTIFPQFTLRLNMLKLIDLLALIRQVDFSKWRI
jgi:hypothetical protein